MSTTQRAFTIGGKLYTVVRTERWDNDETQIHFTVWKDTVPEAPIYDDDEYGAPHHGNPAYLGPMWDVDRDDMPTRLEVIRYLAEKKRYQPTPLEVHALDVDATEKTIKGLKGLLEWRRRDEELARAAIATAVQDQTKKYEELKRIRQSEEKKLEEAEKHLAELRHKELYG